MTEETKCIITDVKFKSKELHPIIVSFQNGQLRPDDAPNFKCSIYKDEHNGGKRVVEMTSSSNCVYRGSESPHNANICRTLIAIRNKKTNNVRLIEADNVQLTPVFPDTTPEKSKDTVTNLEGYSKLNKAFGSKKVKRRSELHERMKFEVQSMTDQLTEAVSGVEIAQEDLSVPSIDSLNTFIPCNRQASSVDEVYQVKDIISQFELDNLQEEAEKLLNNMDSCNEEQYSKFFCYYLKCLPASNKLQGIKMLLYAECLLKVLLLPYSALRRKNVIVCPYSKILNTKILDSFTLPSNTGRSRPSSMQDKIISYVIILGLLANNFTLNLEPLMQSVKVRGTRVQVLCQTIGVVPASKTDKNTVLLKLPLSSPVKTFSGKRKRT